MPENCPPSFPDLPGESSSLSSDVLIITLAVSESAASSFQYQGELLSRNLQPFCAHGIERVKIAN
jgi:hypothetical protein